MEPISGMIHTPASPEVQEPSGVQTPRQEEPRREEPRTAPAAPATDRYLPEEKHTPCGLYWVGKDGDGSPRIFFDDPAPKAPEALPEEENAPPERPEKPASGKGEEKCTCDTGKVDREIRQLKTDFHVPARSVDMCPLQDVTPTAAAAAFMEMVRGGAR